MNSSRSFARQVTSFVAPDSSDNPPGDAGALVTELVYRQIAFVHALRLHLRNEDGLQELRGLIDDAELETLLTNQQLA